MATALRAGACLLLSAAAACGNVAAVQQTGPSAGAAVVDSGPTIGPKVDPSGAVVIGEGPPTFTRVWSLVLQPKNCGNMYCHGGGPLKLATKAEAYAALVGVQANGAECRNSGMLRVKPADPDASLLLEKLSKKKPSCGDAMPIGTWLEPECVTSNTSMCNSLADLQLVRDWIAAGAQDD
jgi:hypothetical protein